MKEKRTGVEFSGEFCFRAGQRNCPRLTGAGTRVKKIAGIKSLDVYALALYVDEDAARHALARKFSGQTTQQVAKSQALFEDLVKADSVEKALVIVITSGLVNQQNFLNALDDRLQAPLEAARQTAVLRTFRSQFDAVKFCKGLRIAFTVKGDHLVTKANDRQVGSISSKAMTHALLDIYLGSDAVSQEAKAAFAQGLAGMVTRA